MSATRPSTEFTWASTGTKTAPSAAQKLAGWISRQKPPYDIVNWLYGLIGDWLAYLDGGGGFDSLHALDAAIATGEHGIVDEWNGTGEPGQIHTQAGGATSNATVIAADGRYVFYVLAGSANTVRSFDRALGTAGSTFVASTSPVVALVSNGTTLYVASGSVSTWNIDSFTIATGATPGSWSAGSSQPALAAYLGDVIVAGTDVGSASGDVARFTSAGVEVWSYSHGAALSSVATAGKYVFAAGAAGSGSSTLRCLLGSAGTAVWSSAPTSPTLLGADQRAVFVDANGTLQRRGAADGAVVSSVSTTGGVPVAGTVDQDFVTIIEAGSERVLGYDKDTLAVAWIGTTITTAVGAGLDIASDGASLYVARESSGSTGVVARVYRPNTPTRFRKVAVTDQRTFHHLCLAPSE